MALSQIAKKWVVVTTILIVCLGCHNPYKSGMDALSEGNYESAEKSAKEGLEDDPQSPAYNLLLADAFVGKGEFKQAEPHAQKAFDSGELQAASGRTLGKIRWELGQPLQAVDAWRVAREADPTAVSDKDFGRALETALAMATSIRDFESALALRTELKKMIPDHAEATPEAFRTTREQLADELVRNGELQAAVEIYDALAKDFEKDEYHFERGRLYASLKLDEESTEAFTKYVEMGPKSERSERLSAVAHRAERLGAVTVALHFYDLAASGMPKASKARAEAHLKLASLLLATQMSDQAKPHMEQYLDDMRQIRGEPLSDQYYRNVSNKALEHRAPALGMHFLEEALVQARPSWRVARKLADLYARRARTNDVERVLRVYVDRAQSGVSARVNIARWAMGRLNYELAVFYFESAVKDGGKVTPSVWLELARAYAAVGQVEDVNRSLKTYIKNVKDQRRALLDVASVYRAQRMYEEAEKALTKLMKKEPKDLHIARRLETLYREWGRPKRIHDVYGRWIKARGNDAVDYQMVGERFYRQNEWDEALPYLTKAANLGENSAWLQVADIYKRQRKERDMKKALDNYLSGAKDRVSALNLVWQRYRTSAWSHEAIPILEELVSLDPSNVAHYEQLSELYFEQGRDVEAFEIWKKYIDLSRNPIASLEVMTRRFERNHYDWMLAFLHQIREKHQNPDPAIYRLLGDAHYSASRRSRFSQTPDENAIFSQQNKAKVFYEKYLASSEPTSRELQVFAKSMKTKNMWDVAAKAYEKLDLSAPTSTQHLLNYGSVLLELGKAAEAKTTFAEYYQRRGESVDAAKDISKELIVAQQYDALGPYLIKLMDSGDENLLRSGFMQLAEVYRQTDRTDKLSGLATDYLSKTQNPTEARRTVLLVLNQAGQWDQAVQQLERISEIQGDEFKYSLGVALYKTGDADRADSVFRDYAASSVTPQEAWMKVAQFYENHAKGELAEEAFDMAVGAGQISSRALSERGRIRIVRGRIEDGQADFEEARSKVEPRERGVYWKLEVKTLQAVGRYAAAADTARRALVGVFVEREFYYQAIAASALTGADVKRSERLVGELKSAGLPVDELVPILLRHRYLEETAKVIEDEIANGDYVVGGALAVSHAEVFTELGGIGRLLRTLQPLLERGAQDGRLKGQIGEYLVREGHLDDGVLYLRASIDQGERHHRPLLAAAYLKMGHLSEALDLYQSYLGSTLDVGKAISLRTIAAQLEVSGQSEILEAFLGHLMSDSLIIGEAAPILAKRLVARGDISGAMALVRRMWADLNVESESALSNLEERHHLADVVLVSVAEVIASEGYMAEAMSLINEAPSAVSDTESLRDLKLRLAAASPEIDTKKEVDLAMMSLGESNDEAHQKLKIARLVLLGGDPDHAITLAEPMLKNGNFDVAREALRILTAAGTAKGEETQFGAWVAAFLDGQPDKANARKSASEALRILGADLRVNDLLEDSVELVPTESNIRSVLAMGLFGSDTQLVEASAELFWRVAEVPAADVQNMAGDLVERQDPAIVGTLLTPHREAFPEIWGTRAAELKLWYRIGEPEKAREEILAYLESVQYEPLAVEHVILLLDGYRLHGEIARFVGPRIEIDNISLNSLEMLGRANLHLGFQDDGLTQLDRYVERSPDPAYAASILAANLLEQGLPKAGLRFAEMAIEKRPGRGRAKLYRAMAKIALGDASADDDVAELLKQGTGRQYALFRLGRYALDAGLEDLAAKYLGELARSATSSSPESSVAFALQAYREAKRPDLAVAFVEKRWPLISSGHGVAGEGLLPSLAGLYEEAGMQERSFQLYEEGILRELVTSPFGGQVNTYRNNLAYTYSTTNKNIDEALKLIRLAIAGDRRRNPSFIDTLGWLEYRRGNLKAAEVEVSRALTSTMGSTDELVELYKHLAELKEAQGWHRKAVWIRIYLKSIE